jgi:GH35 family endo-1,4-beta-xylanase
MARRRSTAGLALLGLLTPAAVIAAPVAVAAPSTVHRTSFEDGTADWFGRGTAHVATSTAAARTGDQSLLVTGRSANWHGPALDVRTIMPAGTYTVEAYVQLAPGSEADVVTASVARTPVGGAEEFDTVQYQAAVTDSAWTKVSGTYTYATTNSKLELYLESPDAGLSFFVDDVTITGEAAAPTGPGTRSDITTDFESGLAGWGPRGDGVQVTTTTSDRRSGTSSLQVSGRTQPWHGPTVDVSTGLAVGQTVGVSVWAKLTPGQTPTSLKVTVQRDRAGTATAYEGVAGASAVVGADQWVQLKGTYTLGAPIDTAQLYVEGDAGVSFLLDDFALTGVTETPIQDVAALKDVLGAAGIEHVGAAIDQRETVGRPSQLLLKHYNAFTPENDGKPAEVQPTEGTFTFGDLDRLLDYADANDVQVYGHVLVWHSQTPDWFFQRDGQPLTSSPEDQALLRSRMEAHIKGIADHIDERYPDGDSPIWAWDVVNEVIDDSDNANPHDMRDSRWFQVLGETFVDDAFRLADTYFPNQKLFINDYNTEMPTKRVDYLELIASLKARGVPIDGVGHQAHVDFARPVQWLDDSLTAVEKLDPTLLQVITELDVSDSKENNGADVSNGTVPQHSPAMAAGDAETEVGYYYRDLFAMLRTHAASVESVTFWGISNARSWLRTWPAARPWEAPLPFDDDLQAAPAYWGIVDPSTLADRPADVLPPRIGGHDTVTATASGSSGAVVRYTLPEAGDTRDGRLVPVCAPASGTRFAAGTTTVTCTATDRAGNAATPSTFRVVVAPAARADLRAVVTGPSTVTSRATATYTLTVTNAGPSAAQNLTGVLATTGLAKATVSPGAGTGSVTVGGTTVSGTRWTVPSLASGQSVTFTVTGTVSARRGSIVTAVGGAVSTTADPSTRNNATWTVSSVR